MYDYGEYHYEKKEFILIWLKGAALALVFLQLFYDTVLASVAGAFLYGFYYTMRGKRDFAAKRRWELNLQFKEGISAISNALQAGYSLENSMEAARRDLAVLYHGQSYIEAEFAYMEKQLQLNRTIEELFADLALRSGIEDIHSFSQVLITAKRMGGNLTAIIRSTAKNISEKLEVQREIQTMVAGKKLEGKFMCLIPPGMILYLRASSPGFLNPLYHNMQGAFMMSVLLVFYLLAYHWEMRILDMKV